MTIGVDIEDIERFKNKSDEFINRVFTDLEKEYCLKYSKPESHFAARFCAKEAVIKALTPLGISGVSLNKIEVYHNELGFPQVRILEELNKNISFQLSISHDKTKAIAFVVAEVQ